VYGGPGFQAVDEKWNQYDYQTYMAGSQGVVYAIIDPMGSGFMGIDWLFSVYKNFGGPEVTSTIEVTKHLQNNLAYIDSKRTAIWGWSYGGFLSLSVLAQDKDGVFQCAASVAPVVDWRLYDTYYTVRFISVKL
jgi:dipeptidyl aminopeptidase/acylaminoacyl peptidase